jgi:hypothetical protein
MLAYGLIAAALWVATTSISARSRGTLPGWLWRTGYIAALLLLPGLLFVPIFLSALALAAWVLGVSLWLFSQGSTLNESSA